MVLATFHLVLLLDPTQCALTPATHISSQPFAYGHMTISPPQVIILAQFQVPHTLNCMITQYNIIHTSAKCIHTKPILTPDGFHSTINSMFCLHSTKGASMKKVLGGMVGHIHCFQLEECPIRPRLPFFVT